MTEPHSERPQPRRSSAGQAAASAPRSGNGASGAAGSVGATPAAARADASSTTTAATRAVERATALWLVASQRTAGRAAHEVKNALNAVAVNLEVVRSRLARAAAEPDAAPQPSPAAAARFAEVASAQFEALSSLAESLLSLARAPREPADVVHLLAPLAVVYDAIARGDGGSLHLQGADGGAAALVAVPATTVRLALATALDAAVGRGRVVTCAIESGTARPRVHVSWLGAVAAPAPDADALAALADCGISVAPDGATTAAGAITIEFGGATSAAAAPAGRSRGDASSNKDQ